MKDYTTEQKAQRYDEAIERTRFAVNEDIDWLKSIKGRIGG